MRMKPGFTLIEVLVTLLILVFGLLGIAALMAKGQRAAYEAYQRQQALALANDMLEHVRSNPGQAVAYTAGAPTTAPLGTGSTLYSIALADNCIGTNCSAADLASYDLAMWDGLLKGYGERTGTSLIGSVIAARGCIEELNQSQASCPVPGAGYSYTRTLRVSVAWQGQGDTVPPTASTCGSGLYGSVATRRLVALDAMVSLPCP